MSNETNNTSSIISKVWSFCNTLPDPDVLANDIIENLEAGLESFRELYNAVK